MKTYSMGQNTLHQNLAEALFEAHPQPLWIVERDSLRFLAVNAAALEQYGYLRRELLSMTMFDVCAGQQCGDLDFAFEHRRRWLHRKRNGGLLHVSVDCRPMQYSGKAAWIVGITPLAVEVPYPPAQECTDSYFRKLSENMVDMLTVLDRGGRVKYASPSHSSVLGYSPEQFIGAPVFDYLHPDDVERVRRTFQRRLKTGKITRAEFRFRHCDGTWRTLEASAQDLSSDPVIQGILVSSRDTTQRRKQEEHLRAGEQRLRHAQRAGHIRTWEHNLDDSNAPEWMAWVHPGDRARIEAEWAESLRREQPFEAEFRALRPDGLVHWLFTRGDPVIDPETGKTISLLGIDMDISERKQIEFELARSRDQAREESRIKSGFLAHVSHEIRTPMNGILGAAALLQDTVLDSEQSEYTGMIEVSAEALLGIINEILDLSRIESGRLELAAEKFEPCKVLEEAARTMGPRALAKALTFTVNIAPEMPRYLIGDAGRIRQILLNLIANAIKFTPQGMVSVRLDLKSNARGGSCLAFEVTDTGIGIAAEAQTRLFSPFMQADSSTHRRYGGTGLGLAISKQLVTLMGGSIQVESSPGGGSRFSFEIPAIHID